MSCSSSKVTRRAYPPSWVAHPATQAVLPIRGKILNVERACLEDVEEPRDPSAHLRHRGAGVGEEFDVEKRRYDKVIAMCDADVDGQHIRTLLLTFFFRQMKTASVEPGYVFIAQPPLYSTEVGREKIYLKDDGKKQVSWRTTRTTRRTSNA